jgi:iron complex outermembrane receptor protein
LGGAYNQYKARITTILNGRSKAPIFRPDYQYERDDAFKTDFNIFGKADYKIGKITLFADMQYRHVYYSFLGFNDSCKMYSKQVYLIFLTLKPVSPTSSNPGK